MFKLFKNLKKKDLIYMAIGFVLIASQVWLELKMPDYMSEITQLVQTEGSKMRDILLNGGYMLLCALASLICAIITGYLIANVSARFSKNVRKKLFNKVLDLSNAEIKEFKTSSLITRTTNDITQIQMFIAMGLQMLVKAPLTAIWAVTKILNKNWQWSALTAVAVVILLSTVATIMVIVLPRFKIVQKLIDKVNNVTRENLTGIRVIRAFNAEKYQEDKFAQVNNDLTKTQLFNQKAFAIMQPVMYLVMYFLTLAIYIVGIVLIKDSLLADKIAVFADMVVFSSYSMQVIMSFLMLAMIFMILPRANVSANRINEVLDKEITIKNGHLLASDAPEKGTIEFKNVSFKYPDAEEYVLKDISFKVAQGKTVAFIGSTGSGKSTLINLIPRFYDVTSGAILIDGVNVQDYDLTELYNKLGYVPQKAVMFNDTIEGNITFGKNGRKKSKSVINKALEVAQAEEFVNLMEKKTKTMIAQGGTNISGGQKQRLAIARAIAREPEIYIFDDSFSALDYKTDATLRRELKKYTKEATCLIVAQRIGTIMNADLIVVLDEGKCVGLGTHQELLKNCPVYQQIALSQLSKEELENA